ncbi:MAG: nitrite reductase small subunit NirD [Pseudomonadota bacterium]
MGTTTQLREVSATTVLCTIDDLIENAGVCALFDGPNGEEQIALYYLPAQSPSVFALNNWDPLGKANVLSRGILGSVNSTLVVASPLYKQHFSLISGECLEDSTVKVKTYDVDVIDNKIVLLEQKETVASLSQDSPDSAA